MLILSNWQFRPFRIRIGGDTVGLLGPSGCEKLLPFSLSHSNNLAVLAAWCEGPATPPTHLAAAMLAILTRAPLSPY